MKKNLSLQQDDEKMLGCALDDIITRASVQQADSKGKAYRSGGVPAIIVNGKYRIEGGMAGSNASMIRVADYLIEKERQQIAASQ